MSKIKRKFGQTDYSYLRVTDYLDSDIKVGNTVTITAIFAASRYWATKVTNRDLELSRRVRAAMDLNGNGVVTALEQFTAFYNVTQLLNTVVPSVDVQAEDSGSEKASAGAEGDSSLPQSNGESRYDVAEPFGKITIVDVSAFMSQINKFLSEEEREKSDIFSALDFYQNGMISIEDVVEANQKLSQNDSRFDLNHDGEVSQKEITKVLIHVGEFLHPRERKKLDEVEQITEYFKIHFSPIEGVKGTIYARLNGIVVASVFFDGKQQDAAIRTITGSKGSVVEWSNTLNNEKIETELDGTGDNSNRGHYINFKLALAANLPAPQPKPKPTATPYPTTWIKVSTVSKVPQLTQEEDGYSQKFYGYENGYDIEVIALFTDYEPLKPYQACLVRAMSDNQSVLISGYNIKRTNGENQLVYNVINPTCELMEK